MDNNEADIMYNNGKKKIILASPNIFTNSKCIFIEYNDIIRSPGFNLLYGYLHNGYDEVSKVFDLSKLKDFDISDLYDFYTGSITRNPLYELEFTKEFDNILKSESDSDNYGNEFRDNMYERALSSISSLYDRFYLQFYESLLMLIDAKLVGKYIIYNEYDNEYIKNDIEESFKGAVEFRSGDLATILKTLPRDTTYVFSDITKVKTLSDSGMMEYSSILFGDRYEYNYTDNDEYIIPMDIFENRVYKFNTFNATILYDDKQHMDSLFNYWKDRLV